jgi:DNA modification methylase
MIELNKIYNEPCLETLKRMPNDYLDCVITSPPYWQLRDYGYEGQWGLEPTFHQYLEHLWEMMDEIYRVLKPTGTCWVNLGDTYSTQSGTNAALARGKNYESESTYLTNRGESEKLIKPKNMPNKCLLLIPHRFAIGCIDRGWIVRNDIVWAKRNGMPESVTDRFSKKHEYFFFMVKSEKYYFDLDAVRDKIKEVSIERYKYEFTGQEGGKSGNFKGDKSYLIPTTKITKEGAEMFGSPRARQHREGHTPNETGNPLGKNPGSVSDFWDIPTKPSSNQHYAAYNDELIKKPILAGCPEGGIIYDPFMGTGSTAESALRANRKFIGSEMSEKYIDIANKRLEPYLLQSTLF